MEFRRMQVQLWLVAMFLCYRTESSRYPRKALQTLALEDVVGSSAAFLYPEAMIVQWVSDTEFIKQQPGAGVVKYNALTHHNTTILSEEELYDLDRIASYHSSFSEDGRYVLVKNNFKKVYRYSSTAEYSVYDIQNKSLRNLGQGPLQVVVWANNNALAYVKDNNVFYVPDAAHPDVVTQLTTEGVPGEVYFGAPDWIYEEEVFNGAEALWFSPRGTYLAVALFNDTNVESAVYPCYGNSSDISNQYPELVTFKYPKAGRTNPQVGLRVYKLDDPQSEPWNIPAPVDVVGMEHILGRVNWASDQNLVVLWLNRRQSVSILVNCDLKQDKCSMIKENTETNGWIDIKEPFFDRNGTRMVEIQPLYNGDRRFSHAARLNFDTLTTEDLSPGNSTVGKILGWDQDSDTVYYLVSPADLPWRRELWATSQGVVRCVTCKKPSCYHVTGVFSPGASFGLITCSSATDVPKIYLYHSKDDRMELLNDNAKLSQKLSSYKLPLPLFTIIPLEEDVVSHVKLLLPRDMQKGKKYPMILRVYAGPGTTRVKDNYDLEFYNLYLASNRSFIVAAIDVRGSGAMGVEAMHAVNRALGTVEVTDTLASVRRLVELYPFIDQTRIGVWGWSYGGYVSTMMLIKDDQHVLACGAAVAPVTSWLYYDTIYTERYMDTPSRNPAGYQRSDVLVQAKKLRGRRFLLVHGTGDDNVHYQHSLQLAKQLQHADIAFEQMSYTDENHSLLSVSRHFYHTLDRFWTECFH